MIQGYAATEAGGELKVFEYEPGALGADQVQIRVEHCGICFSDLSMLNNDWAITEYPFMPGHEVVGIVEELGEQVRSLTVGQRVGVGWYSAACLTCEQCMSGDHNLCGSAEATIVGRHGGFADRVRAQAACVIPLPDGLDVARAGPLYCGGVTVFNPLVQMNVKPTDRVGVIGIGGLGHLALMFARAWGCEVTAFSSTPAKTEEAKRLGAHHVVNSRDPEALKAVEGKLDLILSTANVPLDWAAYIAALRPKGRLHILGVPPDPIPVEAFPLLIGQKAVTGSPVGSPGVIAKMLEFAARHQVNPIVERFKFDQVNDAMEKLRSGAARYRIVLSH